MKLKTALFGTLPLFTLATLPAAIAETLTQDQVASESQEIEEIVVSGVRGSLNRALSVKMDAVGVTEAISAEDIADFPDLNIGESLARIAGVTVNRSVGGEGNQVSVRGGQTDWTKVTVNGLSVATGNQGREFDFDVFASELFTNAKVYKSNSADLTEGGLTATIDLKTPRAFDYDEDKLAFSASVADAEKGDNEVKPRLVGMFSKQFSDSFGALVSVSHSKTAVRGDVSEGWGWSGSNSGFANYLSQFNQANAPTVMINGEAVSDLEQLKGIAANTITPELPRLGPQLLARDRTGVTAALQLRPSDSVELTADVLFADFSQDEIRATIDGIPGFNMGQEWTSMTIENGIAVAGTINNQSQRSETLSRQVDTQLTHITLGAEWFMDETWTSNLVYGNSRAQEDELSRTYLWEHLGTFSYDFSDNPHYPNLQGADWLDASQFSSQQLRFRPFQRDDEEHSLRVDFTGDYYGALQRLKFGMQWRDRVKGQTRLKELRPAFSADFADYAIAASDLFDNYHADAPYRSDFLLTDVDKANAELLPGDLSSSDVDKLQTYEVEEQTYGIYFKSEFAVELGERPLFLDFGARYVKTDVTSSGFQQSGGQPEAVAFVADYSDWLPSFNAKWQLHDDVIARMSASRTMTRPTLANIAPSIAINPTVLSASRGNPELDPFRANNLDLSLEWYFGDEALLAATYYHKDIESFIVSETFNEVVECSGIVNDQGQDVCGSMFQVTKPVNGESGTLRGIELQYQQPLSFLPAAFDGMGVLLNATFSESERTTYAGVSKPLSGQSDDLFNAVVYYENYGLSLRAAYNYRSDYTTGGRNGFDNLTESYGQLDLSASYALNDQFTLFFEGLNMTGEDIYTYQVKTTSDGTEDYQKVLNDRFVAQGRVVQVGIRGSF
ncbi:TonB-dependent receptor [Pseudidiomarina sediminum]|uniref:TonB-dependent receptor n=1 Tax=Pseudidiomarina sediminum TaxID=431675 RepID=A0A432Z3I2_9GAMM|nr:TonB-dependent receptor [Pseudidiomarina sediminum]RUO72446.1 TonB-dependent receptor [Pseudidiomarina sediminum]